MSVRTQGVIPLKDLRRTDGPRVGGKCSSLGEMISQLAPLGIKVPDGFATTAEAFREFLEYNNLVEKIGERLRGLDPTNSADLEACGAEIRSWVLEAEFSVDLLSDIAEACVNLGLGSDTAVAVRSSATAEDLADASFAGQQDTYLNVRGIENIILKIKAVFSSLFTNRAISYRAGKGFDHMKVAMSACVQMMVRSDQGVAGVAFTLSPENGRRDEINITGSWGLGEMVVSGRVNPDEWRVWKPGLTKGKSPIIGKRLGSKLEGMIFSNDPNGVHPTEVVETDLDLREKFSLLDEEVLEIAQAALVIEKHYGCPMDIEWAIDGEGELWIVQARPETVHSQKESSPIVETCKLLESGEVLCSGVAIGEKIAVGRVRVVEDVSGIASVKPGDILVTDATNPDWEPAMKVAAAIVTNRGGRTCHAAIIAREHGIPAIVGCGNATSELEGGSLVTVSCAEGDTGNVYFGELAFDLERVDLSTLPKPPVKIYVNLATPELAAQAAQLPVDGVGLARLEFLINKMKIHPRAALAWPETEGLLEEDIAEIKALIQGHEDPADFFVQTLGRGIATIAAAFYPRPVIVRMSDLKTNEYRKLLGGEFYEPNEENPMLGYRGAARYLDPEFADCFAMECKAVRFAREAVGLDNIKVMIPFVRTDNQLERVVGVLAQNGLRRGENGLRIIMMCELPTNALLAKDYLKHVDGFSVGSNDLTQTTTGTDRDSGHPVLTANFRESDPAVKMLIAMAIKACREEGKYIGICGQGPSDDPEFARWLVEQGITSISLTPDAVVKTIQAIGETG